jgi:hypothetical protein
MKMLDTSRASDNEAQNQGSICRYEMIGPGPTTAKKSSNNHA